MTWRHKEWKNIIGQGTDPLCRQYSSFSIKRRSHDFVIRNGLSHHFSFVKITRILSKWKAKVVTMKHCHHRLLMAELPWEQGSWGQHGAHLGPTGPRWPQVGPMNFAIWVDIVISIATNNGKNVTLTFQSKHMITIKNTCESSELKYIMTKFPIQKCGLIFAHCIAESCVY